MVWKSDKKISKFIESTLLSYCTESDINTHCKDALKYRFFGVCFQSTYIKRANEVLSGSDIRIVSVIDFPYGASGTNVKCLSVENALQDGVDELDMVMNINQFLNNNLRYVEDDITEVHKTITPTPLKVIIQTPILSDEQIATATKIVMNSGAEFVKTSTGISTEPTTPSEVKIIEETSGGHILIKASGGINSYRKAVDMIKAGAVRIGTSSGKRIVDEERYKRDA